MNIKEGTGRIDLSDLTEKHFKDLPKMLCIQCGKDLDLLGMFTQAQVCLKCCKKNHKEWLK